MKKTVTNTYSPKKSREIPREYEHIAGQGHPVIDPGVNRKRVCDFLLVINRKSHMRFRLTLTIAIWVPL